MHTHTNTEARIFRYPIYSRIPMTRIISMLTQLSKFQSLIHTKYLNQFSPRCLFTILSF